MLIEIVINASFLISAIAFFGLSLLFADALLLRFELKTALKALGFAAAGGGCLFNLFQHSYSPFTFWLLAISFLIIFISFIIDPHSKLLFGIVLPLPILLFTRDHLMLFFLCILIAISVFQLAYTTKHRDLIPLGVGFVLITVGEYLYSLEMLKHLEIFAATGSFLYLFASLVLLFWLWSYLAIRFYYLVKSKPF